jgi:hypothetical protein
MTVFFLQLLFPGGLLWVEAIQNVKILFKTSSVTSPPLFIQSFIYILYPGILNLSSSIRYVSVMHVMCIEWWDKNGTIMFHSICIPGEDF